MSDDWTKSDAVQHFMWTVQALALPATEQIALYPNFVVVADELALEHEETQRPFLAAAQAFLSASQRDAIERLELEQMGWVFEQPRRMQAIYVGPDRP